MRKIQYSIYRQAGLSIVELMIAVLISLFLLGGLIQMYISNQQTYKTLAGTSKLQEAARYVNAVVTKEIRMANHAACKYFPTMQNDIINIVDATSDHAQLLWAVDNNNFFGFQYNGGWAPAIPNASTFIGNVLVNPDTQSDIIVIRRISEYIATLQADHATTAGKMVVFDTSASNNKAGNMPLQDGRIYAVNNCSDKVAVFQAQAIAESTPTSSLALTPGSNLPGNSSASFNQPFPKGSEIGQIETSVYYLQTHSDMTGVTQRDLVRVSLDYNGTTPTHKTETLIENIESLQFLYGEDTDTPPDNVANKFVHAHHVTNWRDVVSIRMAFTASTPEKIHSGLSYSDTNCSAPGDANQQNLWCTQSDSSGYLDGKIVRRFSSVIDLRNPPKE